MLMKDQVVIVTGGASGIGRAICERFANEGARAVIVAYMRAEPLEGGEARFVRTDVINNEDLQTAIDAAQAFGGGAKMVNNAGVLRPTGLLDTTFDDYEKTITVNGRGVFFGSDITVKMDMSGGPQMGSQPGGQMKMTMHVTTKRIGDCQG